MIFRSLPILIALLWFVEARQHRLLNGYAPRTGNDCPADGLVRPAKGLSPSEKAYVQARQVKAGAALSAWVKKIDSEFGASTVPVVGLSHSGGGFRALLTGAGVVQAFDERDGKGATNGLYQGITYQTGLSGGGWLLSALIGNDWPTISTLRDTQWVPKFKRGLIASGLNPRIMIDVAAKKAHGGHSSVVNLYGRALSYMLFMGKHGGVSNTLSGVADSASFKDHSGPYPIITAVQIDTSTGSCKATPSSLQFEMSPYEWGSWDSGVAAFTPTKYLGTAVSNGKPTKAAKCVTNYDNLGYVLGTSSSLFNMACSKASDVGTKLPNWLNGILKRYYKSSPKDVYAAYPNPFQGYAPSNKVSTQKILNLVDGGESHENNPIRPLLRPERGVSVLIVEDSSGEVDHYPQGKRLNDGHAAAKAAGLTMMPMIPPQAEIVAKKLNTKPTFFGCNDPSKITIIWLANTKYSFNSNQPTFKLKYKPEETKGTLSIFVL